MGFKKKTHEELVKQINIKTDFADKAFKKMRAERYGITYCCPFDLDKIVIKNELCGWDDRTISVLPEAYDRAILSDPNFDGSCTPPATFNTVTGLCEGFTDPIESTTTTTTISYTPIVQQNGIEAVHKNDIYFGIDCPLIFSTFAVDGTGSSTQIGPNHWLQTYDGTVNGANIPGVTEISFWNALAKGTSAAWGNFSVKSNTAWISTPTAKTVYIGFASHPNYGVKVNGAAIIGEGVVNTNTAQTIFNPMYGFPTSNAAVQSSWSNSCNASMMNTLNFGAFTTWQMMIYPIDLTAGCNFVEVRVKSLQPGGSMPYDPQLGYVIWDNTASEIISSTQRSDLTELASTISEDFTGVPIGSQGGNVLAPGLDILNTECPTGSTYVFAAGGTCEQCMWEDGDPLTTLTCPEGFSEYYAPGSETLQCVASSGPKLPCDTETLMIYVVNQNGDIMPNYSIIFDGGTYTTNEEGSLIIVVEDASVNTLHTFNLCECFTTSGGCAVQQVDIVVTDPDLETCSTNKPLCSCVAPSFVSEVFSSPNMSITFTDANYAAGNDVTAETYTMYWRLVGQDAWNVISGLTMSSTGTIFQNFLALAPGHYEYKIKSICVDEESNWSATNNFTIPEIPVKRMGCIDMDADNYDPLATTDDSSCTYTVYGCTDVLANNYYGTVPANTTLIDDGSCEYGCEPCTQIPVPDGDQLVDGTDFATLNASSSVINIVGALPQTYIDSAYTTFVPGIWYRFSGNSDEMTEASGNIGGIDENGVLQKMSNLIVGQTYDFTTNFTLNPSGCTFYQYTDNVLQQTTNITGTGAQSISFIAQSTSDTFVFKATGAILAFAFHVNGTGTMMNGIPGCCDPTQQNYNPNATCDNGSCQPFVYGCMDPSASNWYIHATVDDGSCLWLGCTDPSYQWCNNYIGPAGPAPSPTGFIDPITGQVLTGTNVDDGSCTACQHS